MKCIANIKQGLRILQATSTFGVVMLSFCFYSCSQSSLMQSNAQPENNPGNLQNETMVPITIQLEADGNLTVVNPTKSSGNSTANSLASSSLQPSLTKATNTPNERAVGDLWVLQFQMDNNTSTADGSLIYQAYIPSQNIYQNYLTVEASTMLKECASCRLVVIANSPETLDEELVPIGTKLSDFRQRTFNITSLSGTSIPDDASPRLPMSGETTTRAITLTSAQNISVRMTRLMARMNMTLINKYYNPDTYPYLKIEGVTLRNAPAIAPYYPLTTTVNYMGDVFPEADAEFFKNYSTVTEGVDGNTIALQWYIAPNHRGTGTATTPDDKNAMTAPVGQGTYCTFIQIKGMLQEGSTTEPTEVYYNIYLGENNTTDYNIWANTAYKAQLSITGFNSGMLDVGYDGFEVVIGGLDGTANNTITGWHPDTGLEYIPGFFDFTPDEIDFGNQPNGADRSVTFSINSRWKFSYISGNKDNVIASSTLQPDQEQIGGSQEESVNCTVTFTPRSYTATAGTPAAGTVYDAVAEFITVGSDTPDKRTTIFYRTIPAFYNDLQITPTPGSTISREAQLVNISMTSNGEWSVAANPGTAATQTAVEYQNKTLQIQVNANDTWQSRTVSVYVQYGETSQIFTYTQPGMTVENANVVSHVSSKANTQETTALYDITIAGDYETLPIRAISGNTIVATSELTPDSTVTLKIPTNNQQVTRTITFQYQQNGKWVTFKNTTPDSAS